MSKSYRMKHLEAQRKYQAVYRERMRSDGWKQITVWLEPEAAKAVGDLKGTKLSDFISKAILKFLPKPDIAGELTGEMVRRVTSKVNNKIISDDRLERYMSTALEDQILKLREKDGLTLSQTAKQLADEGFLSKTGKPYSTATIYKAEKRARQRRS